MRATTRTFSLIVGNRSTTSRTGTVILVRLLIVVDVAFAVAVAVAVAVDDWLLLLLRQ